MPDGDLTVNWAFMRNGLIMDAGQSSSSVPYVNDVGGSWDTGTVDFTEGVDINLVDELIWWVDVVDKVETQPVVLVFQ